MEVWKCGIVKKTQIFYDTVFRETQHHGITQTLLPIIIILNLLVPYCQFYTIKI